MRSEFAKVLCEYRGFLILYNPSLKSYGIDGSGMYIATEEAARRIIDTYLRRINSKT